MTVCIQNLGSGVASVESVPFHPTALEIIKTIPGRVWSPERRFWLIYRNDIPLCAARLYAADLDVTIDGVPYATVFKEVTVGGSAVLDALFGALPAHLRVPVYRALAKVLHPDLGGDTALMQQLTAAMEKRS